MSERQASVRALRDAADGPDGEFVDVTPALAEAWLQANENNRLLDQRKVDQYARDMAAGRWRQTNQGLGFGRDGKLYDGQHRLWAVVMSGVTIRTLVVRGMDPDARPTIDVGKQRRVHDQLRMFGGVERAREITAWANATARIVYGVSASLSYDDVERWLAANAEGVAWGLNAVPRTGRRAFGAAPIMAALVFAHRRHPAAVDAFAAAVFGGEGLAAGQPAHTLRELLIHAGRGAASDKVESRAVSLKVLRAAQLHAQGKAVAKLQVGEEGLRYFATAHDAATLPPVPPTKGGSVPELVERARKLTSFARLVHLLCDAGVPDDEVLGWCVRHKSRVPVLTASGNVTQRVAEVLAARRRG